MTSQIQVTFQYEEKEEPTTCIFLLFPLLIYTHRCLHFTAQVSQWFLPNDSRLSPGGLQSFFIQRELCHQLSTTDLERSVSDVGSSKNWFVGWFAEDLVLIGSPLDPPKSDKLSWKQGGAVAHCLCLWVNFWVQPNGSIGCLFRETCVCITAFDSTRDINSQEGVVSTLKNTLK